MFIFINIFKNHVAVMRQMHNATSGFLNPTESKIKRRQLVLFERIFLSIFENDYSKLIEMLRSIVHMEIRHYCVGIEFMKITHSDKLFFYWLLRRAKSTLLRTMRKGLPIMECLMSELEDKFTKCIKKYDEQKKKKSGSVCTFVLCKSSKRTLRKQQRRKFFKCSQCKAAVYCSRPCQKRDWVMGHRQKCKEYIFFNN